jgi:hypothetical protein
MTTPRKKPGVAFWATVVVVAVLMYPISFGPACWVSLRKNAGGRLVGAVYYPILWMAFEKNLATRPVFWYMTAGASADSRPVIESTDGRFTLRGMRA